MSNEIKGTDETGFEMLEQVSIEQETFEKTQKFNFLERKYIIDLILHDINQRKEDIRSSERSTSTIFPAYFGAIFVIIGFAFNNPNIRPILILLPAFIASGVALVLTQQRIVYTFAAYIGMREEEINHILDNDREVESKDYLKYEKLIDKFYSSRRIQLIDNVLGFITFAPILAIYVVSSYYNYKLDNGGLHFYYSDYILYLTVFYGVILIIIVLIFIYMAGRFYYKYARKRFENL